MLTHWKTPALLLLLSLSSPGCLLNSVHALRMRQFAMPLPGHAIVVIGVGSEAAWPYSNFDLIFDEFLPDKQSITGNCFHYNRIEISQPSTPAKIRYFAFDVPAAAYAYSGRNANAPLTNSGAGAGFAVPPGKAIYFGDYVLVGPRSVEYRTDLEAAKRSLGGILPRGADLHSAMPVRVNHARPLLCTP